MHHKKDHLAEARALSGALLVARLAHIKFDRQTGPTRRVFANYLCSSAAKLMLVPSVEQPALDMLAVSTAMMAEEADALVVRTRAQDDAVRLSIDVGLWRLEKAVWQSGFRLFLGVGAPAYLIPDASPEADATCFMVTPQGVSACELTPWNSDEERQDGIIAADALIAAALEGR